MMAASGCAGQLGTQGTVSTADAEVLTYGTNVSVHTAPFTYGPFVHLGAEAAGEVEHDVAAGSFRTDWTLGVQAGYSHWFNGTRLGLQAYGEIGTAIDPSPIDGYFGSTIALPIELSPAHPVTDMNNAFQFVSRHVSFVPQLRVRSTWSDGMFTHRLGGGVALRVRLATDIL
jgi:hypothetical protein